ncbi:hypothetical protein FRB99_008950 [Tulasnella sp. 403]|nr:hypothetical protein FRB99_008950 [Tulasnella sp. 403]
MVQEGFDIKNAIHREAILRNCLTSALIGSTPATIPTDSHQYTIHPVRWHSLCIVDSDTRVFILVQKEEFYHGDGVLSMSSLHWLTVELLAELGKKLPMEECDDIFAGSDDD